MSFFYLLKVEQRALVAQLAEQRPFKPVVVGSNPTEGTEFEKISNFTVLKKIVTPDSDQESGF